ncbi:MMPL family transporter [Uliginosibacterium sp. H3]|uniref:MMPL family transporter n=1 Tax=Uliginosibacterium silvisoli TaxID=3114758 RepID=A0ABU6JXM4_9RHOO|nr:MMPL family transporter [Uliginosibacterium sp. H3]
MSAVRRTLAGKLPLLIWLVALVLCVGVILRTHFVADMSAFLPSNPDAQQRVLVEQLRDGTIARLMIVGIEGGDAASRHRASRELAAKLRQSPRFIGVQNGESATLARDRSFYFNNRYLLSPAVTTEHFTADGLREAIGNSLDSLSGSAGMMLKSLLAKDPTGETLELIDNLQQGGGPRVADDVWVSRDDSRALLLLQTSAAGSDTDAQAATIAEVRSSFEAVRGQSGDQANAMRVVLTGAGVFSVHSRDAIKFDARLLAGLSTVFVVILLLAVYRSTRLLILGLMPVLSGALAGIAAVSLGFGQVHGLTLGFGATLIGEAVDYSIYLFVQSGQNSQGAAPRSWEGKFWRTVLIGVATSVCGFGAMLVSGFPGLAQLGLYSMSGLLAAVLVTRYVLPSLMPKSVNMRDIEPIGARLTSAAHWLARGRVIALGLIAAATVFLCVQHAHIWNHDISALNPVPRADQELDAQLRGELGAPDSRYLLAFNAADEQAALRAAEKLDAPLRKLVDDGVLAGFNSPARMLPSLATQQARQSAMPDAATLRSNLQTALVDMPLRADKLEGFVDDVQAARTRKPLTRADLDGTASALGLDAMLARKSEGYTLLIPLNAPASNEKGLDLQQLRTALASSQLEGGNENLHVIDLRDQAESLYAGYLDEAIRLSAWGLAAVIGVIALALRDARRIVRVLLPLAGSVALVMAGLVLSGTMLSILHLIGLLLTVAVGSNYALFFDQGDEDTTPAQQHRTIVSLVLANLATVVGFGLLATSSVSVLSALGATVGPGALLSLLLAAVLVPAKRTSA